MKAVLLPYRDCVNFREENDVRTFNGAQKSSAEFFSPTSLLFDKTLRLRYTVIESCSVNDATFDCEEAIAI